MFIKTIQRIERILLSEVAERCSRTIKFAVGGGAAVYGSWHGSDYSTCGAPLVACLLFAAASTLLGLSVFSLLASGGNELEGG